MTYDDGMYGEGKPRQQPSRPDRTGPNTWLVLILVVFVAILVYRSFNFGTGALHDPEYEPRAITPRGDLAGDEKAMSALFRQSAPSVVFITTASAQFSFNLQDIPQGAGSGFIYDKQGHIVTNFHVIRNADSARVTLADQSEWDARLVGAAPDHDLAVLRINAPASRLSPLLIGSSQDLEVGQKVFAIGNPFGFDHSLTTGVISGLGREITSVTNRTIRDVIQTDAAINPGNSGGPLLDSAGRLIGVNTAIYSPSGVYAGIGFAVPVDNVNRIVPELIKNGRVSKPVLGIVADERLPGSLGLPGVMVRYVSPNSGADLAGIRAPYVDEGGARRLGDIILAVNGNEVDGTNSLLDELQKHEIGDTVTLRVLRDGNTEYVQVTLKEG